MIFKLMVNFKPGDTWQTIFFLISNTGGSEEKIQVEPVTSPNVSVVRTRIIKNSGSQNNSSAPKANIPVRIGSDLQFDPIPALLKAFPSPENHFATTFLFSRKYLAAPLIQNSHFNLFFIPHFSPPEARSTFKVSCWEWTVLRVAGF